MATRNATLIIVCESASICAFTVAGPLSFIALVFERKMHLRPARFPTTAVAR